MLSAASSSVGARTQARCSCSRRSQRDAPVAHLPAARRVVAATPGRQPCRPRRLAWLPLTRASAGFEEMSASRERKYFMVGGKGGVGKTSLSASLAVKFAAAGHHTLIVSTDPAHSLSDSLAQSVSGGSPVLVEGTEGYLYGLEIDPDASKADFQAFTASPAGAKGVQDFMGSMGLGSVLSQLEDLKLGELLDTPPPGLDEALAITKVVSFIKDEQYARFTRIVFDTAPTGHTLRLLSLPDFLDATIGKVVRLRQKLSGAASAVKSLFGQGDTGQDEAVAKLETLKARLLEVKELFRDAQQTEFVIVTIPTVLAIAESGRLLASLRAESVPVRRLVVNQLLRRSPAGDVDLPAMRADVQRAAQALDAAVDTARGAGVAVDDVSAAAHALAASASALGAAVAADASFLALKRKDQARAMALVTEDVAGLGSLQRIEAPLFDLEIRGVPALNFFGSNVWT